MKKEFENFDDAEAFVLQLYGEDKWAIAAMQLEDKYIIQWVERKTYTSHDGNVHPDEVWVTKDGDLLLIQDIEAEHARNIIRMMLRQERTMKEKLSSLMDSISGIGDYLTSSDENTDGDDSGPEENTPEVPPNTVFH